MALGICGDCIKKKPEEALAMVKRVHAENRSRFGLPPEPPRDVTGVRCRLCANECSIPEGGSGAGYPRYAHSKGVEYGYKNLAVFYGACSFNCLFCQNWHYRELTRSLSPTMSARELAGWVDDKTSCICFFGGDPSPQMPHALETSRIAVENAEGILRICWESNGNMAPGLMEKAAILSLESGGTIKFDLKAWDENLHIALCGVSNKQTLRNFRGKFLPF
jgi:pyruvate formate lyase activating enzyme